MLVLSLPDTLQEWYSLVSGMSFEKWKVSYQELLFLDWYQKYKKEIDAKYIFWSDYPDHNGYKGQGHILSAREFQSMYSGVKVTDARDVYRICAAHQDCNCSGSLWALVKFDKRCPLCNANSFLRNNTLSIYERYKPVSSVYCDNMELKRRILLHKPVADNLFSHEVVMLAYAAFSHYTTASLRFSGIFKYDLHVEYPEFLFHSLVARGYIRECTDDEFLDACNREDLRLLLKAKNIKPGNTKTERLKRAKAAYTGAEAITALGFKHYVLSDAGKNIINAFPHKDVYEDIVVPLSKYWNIPGDVPDDVFDMCNKLVDKRLQQTDIKIVDTSVFDLDINTPSYEGHLYLASVEPRIKVFMNPTHHIHRFLQKVTVHVFCNEFHIRLSNVTHLMVLSKLRKLIFGTQATNGKIVCACVDLVAARKLFEEQISEQLLVNPTSPEYGNNPHQLFPDSTEGIICGDYINYYLSPADELSELIINAHFANKYTVRNLPSIISKDVSTNYCISIPVTDLEMHRLLMFLIINRKIQEPQIMGTKIFDILFDLSKRPNSTNRSGSRILQMIKANASEHNEEVKEIADLVLSEFNGSFTAVCDSLKKIYPNRALHARPFGGYTAQRNTGKDKNFIYAYEHQDVYKEKYDTLLLSLKEKGIIRSKWISEFSLYLLVKSYFNDASYQYRSEWLGQQSLDIFVPSLSVAFEYQGIQHSQPVEMFGGEDHFLETVERDKRKKALCIQNKVALVYWNFDEPIDDSILALKLGEIKIALPNKKDFPDLSIGISNTTKSFRTDEKQYVYQYDTQFNLVGTFATIKEAAESAKVSTTSIAKSLRGERLLAGGCFWFRGAEPLLKIPDIWKEHAQAGFHMNVAKKVKQYTADGDFVAEYPSIGQAARTLNLREDGIRSVLQGKQKLYHGFKWEVEV